MIFRHIITDVAAYALDVMGMWAMLLIRC